MIRFRRTTKIHVHQVHQLGKGIGIIPVTTISKDGYKSTWIYLWDSPELQSAIIAIEAGLLTEAKVQARRKWWAPEWLHESQ